MDSTSPTSRQHEEINTFVFLDLESTGLLDLKQNCRITELCMAAVSRMDMFGSGALPRVVNKVTLCINPIKPISSFSSQITGLYNDSLEHQKTFSAETVQFINSFLDMQRKPICLLAHNGNRFDFPLLVAELRRIKQSFNEEILCADTLEMFRSCDGLSPRYEPNSSNKIEIKTENSRSSTEVTPSKFTTPIHQSPQKRRLTNDEANAVNNISPKVHRQSNNTCVSSDSSNDQQKQSREKVKVALKFDDANELTEAPIIKADHTLRNDAKELDKKEELERNDETNNELAKTNEDKAEPEFSSSLEDTDYLMALEEIENDINDQSLKTKETNKECSPTTISEMEKASFSNVACYTGYHVKTDTNKSHKIEEPDKCECSEDQNKIKDELKCAEILESKNNEVIKSNVATKKIDTVSDINVNAKWKDGDISPRSDVSALTAKSEKDVCDKGKGLLLKADSVTKPDICSTSVFSSESSTDKAINKSTISTNVYTKPLNAATQNSSSGKGRISTGKSSGPGTTAQNSPLTQSNELATKSTPGSPFVYFKSYKLKQIYQRKFGTSPPVSHSAEDDCVTLLKVVKCTPFSIEWIDEHAVLFSSILMPY